MTTNEIICSNIAELRKKQGLSQESLAGMLGVTFQAVSKWENQLSCPDIALIPKIAEIFQVSIDFLFGRADWKAEEKGEPAWPNDENLHAVVFQGHRMLNEKEITKELSEIELTYNGAMQGVSITSHFSIRIEGDIAGSHIQSGEHIDCADITGSRINAGTNITCSDITASGINAGTNITCGDIIECDNVNAGTDITCSDVIECGRINAGTNITAGNIIENEE